MSVHSMIELEFGNVPFEERGNQTTRKKTSQRTVENQLQTQPTYDDGSGTQAQDTLVGGERSRDCAIPSSPLKRNKTTQKQLWTRIFKK